MRIYVAAPYELRTDAVRLMNQLHAMGHVVTSRWLTGEVDTAQGDFEDIDDSRRLLLLNPPGWENKGTGGRHVEVGYALATKVPVVILGVRSNIFHGMCRMIDRLEDL